MPRFSKTITIKRSEWRRAGFGCQATQLYNPYETTGYNKCCLGQYLEQCDVPLEVISSHETPDSVEYSVTEWTPEIELLVDAPNGNPETTWIADQAMSINDDLELTNDQREKKLTVLFAEKGVTLVFVD